MESHPKWYTAKNEALGTPHLTVSGWWANSTPGPRYGPFTAPKRPKTARFGPVWGPKRKTGISGARRGVVARSYTLSEGFGGYFDGLEALPIPGCSVLGHFSASRAVFGPGRLPGQGWGSGVKNVKKSKNFW